MQPSKKGSILPKLGLILGGSLVALVLIEFSVRFFFEEPIQPRFIVNSGYGVRANQTNIQTKHIMPGEYEVTITTNGDGLRGRQQEYDKEKTVGVYRIALIGDSFVFGYGVNDHEVISAVLEEKLNASRQNKHRKFEVLNFGVSGFGQAEELVLFRNFVKGFHPDEVILFYYNNDIGNNSVSDLFKVNDQGTLESTGKPYLPGVKIREILYGLPPFRWLFTHSQGWNLVRNRLSYLVQQSLLQKQGLKSFSEEKPKAVELTRELLTKFIQDIRDIGAVPTIFVIPAKDESGHLSSNFPLQPGETVELGTSFLNGKEFLEVTDYYERDSHWNSKGHEKAGLSLLHLIQERTMGQ